MADVKAAHRVFADLHGCRVALDPGVSASFTATQQNRRQHDKNIKSVIIDGFSPSLANLNIQNLLLVGEVKVLF